jgi:hypothetical protein
MTPTVIKEFGDAVVASVKELLGKVVDRFKTQITAIDTRLGQIEAWAKALPTPKDGRDGVDGKDGEPGKDGTNGADGVDGAPGRDGTDGLPGEPGINGKDGRDGIDGKDGADGQNGSDGKNGADGAPGIDGRNGIDGVDGKDGAPGRDGIDGKDGVSVDVAAIEAEIDRRVAAKLAEFKQPSDGRDGRDGKQGPAGRDALSIDILPAIDETRSYATGTFAKHAGGLWRAIRGTDGMDGWDCVVEGPSSIKVEHISDRGFAVIETRSSGAVNRSEFKLPVVIYRGVHAEDTQYERGDQVTWGGSQWIAIEDNPEGKPMSGSKSWQLSCKRGRDGKEVVRLRP